MVNANGLSALIKYLIKYLGITAETKDCSSAPHVQRRSHLEHWAFNMHYLSNLFVNRIEQLHVGVIFSNIVMGDSHIPWTIGKVALFKCETVFGYSLLRSQPLKFVG